MTVWIEPVFTGVSLVLLLGAIITALARWVPWLRKIETELVGVSFGAAAVITAQWPGFAAVAVLLVATLVLMRIRRDLSPALGMLLPAVVVLPVMGLVLLPWWALTQPLPVPDAVMLWMVFVLCVVVAVTLVAMLWGNRKRR